MLGLSVLSQLRIDKSKSADETDNFSCCWLFCGIVRPPLLPLPWGACHTIPVFRPVPTCAFVRGEALWGKMSLPKNTTQAFHYSRQKHFNMQPNKWITSESTDYLRLPSVAEFLIENRNKQRFFFYYLCLYITELFLFISDLWPWPLYWQTVIR